jgi:ribosomal protein S10
MHKRNGVLLRSALSAAAVCAVFAMATSTGAHRAGPLSIATAPESGSILAKSISTIRKPSVEKARGSHEHFATRVIEARLPIVLDMYNGE